jgi:hypothetical protein
MKLLFENWRKHKKYLKDHPYMEPDGLQEAIEDPAAKVGKLPENWFVKLVKLPKVIRVELVEKDKEGKFQRIPGREDPFSVVQAAHTSHEAYHDRFEGADAYMIQKSSAPAGFGPLLYDLVMEEAYPKPLRPDPELVSDAATRVWQGYAEREAPEDIATWLFGDDEGNPLHKEYSKESPTVKLALKRAKKLILGEEETPEPEFVEPEPEPFDVEEFDWEELDDLYENQEEKPIEEDYQADVKRQHRKWKVRLVGKGGNRYNVTGKMKKPSYSRSKSAPVGAGGS